MKKIWIFAAAVLSLTLSCSREQGIKPSVSLACEQPPFLQPGDKIALISPSYYTPMPNVDTAAMILREWGFEPVIGENVGKEYLGHYAGTPKERLADLVWALEDPSIKAILSNRGGYGTIRLVNMIPEGLIKKNPKWLIGFSDITTLLGLQTRCGVMSIHGTMCTLLTKSKGVDMSSTLLRDILTGTIPEYEVPANPLNIPGHATGTLVGGNLCTFSPILGTDADATLGEDIILFIEEVEENMSHIDRLINTLILNGVFDRCKGVVLGEFTDCEANLGFGSVEEMICSYLDDYGIPVLCGFPAGHDAVNLPLLMGAPVTLDVTEAGARLTFDVEGFRKSVWTEDAAAEVADTVRMQIEKQRKLIRIANFLKYYDGYKR